jgi:hypothetical protein
MSQIELAWNDLRIRARNHDELSDDKKSKAIAAYNELEAVFGESFFSYRHPLFQFFLDRSGWRHEWAIWFSGFVTSLKSHPDYEFVVHELKNPDFFGERMSVLEIAEFLSAAGFNFRFDVPILINGVQKEPDLFVQLTPADIGFFVEVSTLGPSEKELEANRVFHELFDFHFFWPLGQCCGQLERPPAPVHLAEIKSKIEDLVKKVREQSSFESLVVPGLVKFGCAAESKMLELQQWASAHGLKVGELSGPDGGADEFGRISRKLKEKLQQVPNDRANVIVLYSHMFAMPPRETSEFASFVHALEDIVYRHPQTGYLVLIFSWTGGNNPSVIQYRDHICVNRRRLYFDCNSIMLIRNRFAERPMPPADEHKFVEAFTKSNANSL